MKRQNVIDSGAARHLEILSRLVIRARCDNGRTTCADDLEQLRSDLGYVAALDAGQLEVFHTIACDHHVVVRALGVLRDVACLERQTRLAGWCDDVLEAELSRISRACERLHAICDALESRGWPVVVIKSLDHWPDFGSDLDLYTNAGNTQIEQVMQQQFRAYPIQRSWGDRLANKWNFRVPGLPELVEIHVQYMGQTGEHEELARRILTHRVPKIVDGREFYIPAPEERIVISTLQRMYRHFYFRLCDMVDIANLVRGEAIFFDELERMCRKAGIWPGVVSFLCLVQNYVESYGGSVPLPADIVPVARPLLETAVQFSNGYLRISKRTAAALYAAELLQAGVRRNVRALVRLPLLPPLGFCALVARSVTGDDKGIW